MKVPSWLAPNADLAEPKVKRFAEEIARKLDAEIADFWATEPTIHEVETYDGDRWTEAWFCLQLKGKVYASTTMVDSLRKTIGCHHSEYSMGKDLTEVLLTARVLR